MSGAAPHETNSALSLPETVLASDASEGGGRLPPAPPTSRFHLLPAFRAAAALAAAARSAQPWSVACLCLRHVVAPQPLHSYLLEGPSLSRQLGEGQRALLWTRS